MPIAWALAIAILIAAATLRVLGADSSGLWLDEIWSLQLAEGLASPLDVLNIRQDNNHPLNTVLLWMLAPGSDPGDSLYLRTPAIVAGVAATAVAGWIGAQRGAKEACATLLLLGTSALMIQYSSEARGYAFVQLFTLTGLLAVSRRDEPTPLWCFAFHASVLLGMLSHFSFVHVYGAILLWWAWSRRAAERRAALTEFAKWHFLPLLFTLALYWVQVRTLPIAGGPELELAHLFGRTGALAIGVPASGLFRWPGAWLALLLALAGIAWLAKQRQDRWLLYASGIFLLPAITLAVRQPDFVAPRYFLLPVLLFLLLLAEMAGGLLRGPRSARICAGVLLMAFVVGNAAETSVLIKQGRGRYWSALMFMANRTEGAAIHVSADHDIRVGVVLGYYAELLPSGKQLAYHQQKYRPASGTEWLVHHRHGRIRPAEQNIVGRQGNPYRLERVFPTGPLSGAHWLVYRIDREGDR